MCMPSIKFPRAEFNTNLTLQSYVFLPFNMTMTVSHKGKNTLRTVYLQLPSGPVQKAGEQAKIRSML